MKNSTGMKISDYFEMLITIVVFAVAVYIATAAQQNLFTPKFLICAVIGCIIAAYFNYKSLLNLIKKCAPKRDQDFLKAKLKLRSEFWAFAALISFVPTLVAYGIELDSSNTSARLEKIKEIKTILVSMKDNKFYQSILTLKGEKQRNQAIDDINEIEALTIAGNGLSTEALKSIKYASYGVRAIGIGSTERQSLPTDRLADNLESLSDSQSEIKNIIKLVPFLTLLFAIYSISRKLALAKCEQISIKNKYEDEDKNRKEKEINIEVSASAKDRVLASDKNYKFNNKINKLFLISVPLIFLYLYKKYFLDKPNP
jgi:hypothetical protein